MHFKIDRTDLLKLKSYDLSMYNTLLKFQVDNIKITDLFTKEQIIEAYESMNLKSKKIYTDIHTGMPINQSDDIVPIVDSAAKTNKHHISPTDASISDFAGLRALLDKQNKCIINKIHDGMPVIDGTDTVIPAHMELYADTAQPISPYSNLIAFLKKEPLTNILYMKLEQHNYYSIMELLFSMGFHVRGYDANSYPNYCMYQLCLNYLEGEEKTLSHGLGTLTEYIEYFPTTDTFIDKTK